MRFHTSRAARPVLTISYSSSDEDLFRRPGTQEPSQRVHRQSEQPRPSQIEHEDADNCIKVSLSQGRLLPFHLIFFPDSACYRQSVSDLDLCVDACLISIQLPCSVGFNERDPIRGQDSINTFKEILELAVDQDVRLLGLCSALLELTVDVLRLTFCRSTCCCWLEISSMRTNHQDRRSIKSFRSCASIRWGSGRSP